MNCWPQPKNSIYPFLGFVQIPVNSQEDCRPKLMSSTYIARFLCTELAKHLDGLPSKANEPHSHRMTTAFYVRRASATFFASVLPSLNSINLTSQPTPTPSGYWIRKTESMHRPHKVSTKILGFGVFMVGVVLFTIGLIIGLEFPIYVTEKIERDQCLLDKNHPFYDKWSFDEEWTRINRLYYMELENPEEFLQGGTPRFQERGPYVYREERQYVNVDFTHSRISYQTKLKQTFAADLTRAECGAACSETDQITLVNTALLQRVHQDGDWDSHVYKQMTKVVKNKIDALEALTVDGIALYEYLGCTDNNCRNQTLDNAQKDICDNRTITFGSYLIKNDSISAYTVWSQFKNSSISPFHVHLLKSVYNHIANTEPADVENCDDTSNRDNLVDYWTVEATVGDNASLSNSNLSQTYIKISLTTQYSTVSVTKILRNHMLTFSNLSAAWNFTVCSESVCEHLKDAFGTVLSYFVVISDFIQLYLFQNFDPWYKDLAINRIYHTLSQRSLAMGYTEAFTSCSILFSAARKGIVTSHSTIQEVFFSSPKLSVSTCLDQGNTDNNMFVREYNGSQFAPPGVYPESSRVLYGYTAYLPPSDNCRACSKPYPNNQSFDRFNEDLHRSITFREKQEVDWNGYRLFRFELSESTFDHTQQCKLINTTSVLNYPSFVGVPNYMDSGCNYLQNMISGISQDKVSYVEVEPWTGRIWRESTKLQTSALIPETMKGVVTQSPFDLINYIGVPLPIHWVDKSAVISQGEIDYFGYKIVRLMSISCGGLIGLTIVALCTMVFSVFVGLLSTRKNRVEPQLETGRASSIIHRT